MELQEQIKQCMRCDLHRGNPQNCAPLCGHGSGDIMIVHGKPSKAEIVAEGGYDVYYDYIKRLFTELGHPNFYYTYLVRCYGTIKKDYVQLCRHWLEQEVALVKPRIIFLLGKDSVSKLIGQENDIIWATPQRDYIGVQFSFCGIPAVPNYGTSYVINNPKAYPQFRSIFEQYV